MQILLIVVYVAAGLIGGITILSFLGCAIKALCRQRPKKSSDTVDDLHAPPCRVITRSSEPPTVYRYVSIKTNDDITLPQQSLDTSTSSSTMSSVPAVVPSAPPMASESTMISNTVPSTVHSKLPTLPQACGTFIIPPEGDDAEVTGVKVRSRCHCEPSCVCGRCISMPPSYDEVVRSDDKV